MKFKICVSLPIKNDNLDKNILKIEKALRCNPKFIELRFDYIKNIELITVDFLRVLKNRIKNKSRVIFTFRNYSEGGKTKIEDLKRIKILKILINNQPDFLDIEMNSNLKQLSKLLSLSHKRNVNLIFSYHNFENTLSYEIAKELILKFEEKIKKKEFSPFNVLDKIVYKLVFTAQNFEDNLIPLKLCKDFSENNRKIISFCMGSLGIFSRIMNVKFGSFLTYTNLEEKTASGQINVETLQEIYKLLFPN